MRRLPARLGVAAAVAFVTVGATAPPAAAHGVGGRGDLPVPLWQVSWGAALALMASFGVLGLLWPAPRLADWSEGRVLPRVVDRAVALAGGVLRLVALVIFAVVVTAAWLGDEPGARNLAPVAIYVQFWVGLQLSSGLVGDVWRSLSPFETLAAAGAYLRGRVRPASGPAGATSATAWVAVAGIAGFLWLELAYHDPGSTAVLAWLASAYSLAVLTAAARYGRSWLRTGEAFAALFATLATLAPFHRDQDGRLRVRPPLSGTATLVPVSGSAALILVVLGGTTFDGLSRTGFWGDIVLGRTGWELTAYNSVGLVWMVGLVSALFIGATRLGARIAETDHAGEVDRFYPSLIPIALGYAIAHYFSLLVFEGQWFVAKLSDPFSRDWDLFGTAHNTIDYFIVSPAQIAWVQVAAIVLGHIAGVVIAHDRSIAHHDPDTAIRAQYPMLVVMVIYTIGGLVLLLGA